MKLYTNFLERRLSQMLIIGKAITVVISGTSYIISQIRMLGQNWTRVALHGTIIVHFPNELNPYSAAYMVHEKLKELSI